MTHNDLISKADVCKRLDINVHTFYRYRRRYPDAFRTVQVGKKTYMRPETLERFLEHLEEEQAAERRAVA